MAWHETEKEAATRLRVWCGLAVLALAVGGVAYAQRPAVEPTNAPQPQPVVLYGVRGTNPTVHPLLPGGLKTVCTEEGLDGAAQQWGCLAWEANMLDLPVVEPPPYQGQCTHLIADQDRARWKCFGAGPLPPHQVPQVPAAAANA